ncbi:MAG: hypothetical protein BGO76_00125 [Caedibacter sp. 38-128]|nr:MAG: hypothetical protein BGO76_00125 [Caedibacter sp. 38-128]
MQLKTFIQNNTIKLIIAFFCVGIFVGLSGSFALILLSFSIGIFVGTQLIKGNLKNKIIKKVSKNALLKFNSIPFIRKNMNK